MPDDRDDQAVSVSAPAEDDLPLSITIRSDDLPEVRLPAFYRKATRELIVDSANWHNDDPELLRAAGPRAVGEAFIDLALDGRFSINPRARLAAALLLEHFGDGLLHDRFSLDLGLVPRNGAPDLALIARRAERDRLVLDLAKRDPWAKMKPRTAAKGIRAAFSDYEANRLAADRKRGKRPTGQDETFWLICRLALPPGGMPKERDLARMIAEDR